MSATQPNIVFILTDQERLPRHMKDVNLDAILPNRARLYGKGVTYDNFYINAAPCTPNRSVIFTGLYTQQTWMVGNAEMKQPDMKKAFPTFGTALQDLGYTTHYFGKWHLSTEPSGNDGLAEYGFENFPLEREFHGDPNQGIACDPQIADKAAAFLATKQVTPFLAVVGLINPHDIMYYPDAMKASDPPSYEGMGVPPNFETPEQLRARKPECQVQYKQLYELVMGHMPDSVTTPEGRNAYIRYMNYYLWLQAQVDVEIGKVLDALEGSGNRDNTIVIFTADHGDQIGSHGLSGKQCNIYEESLNVPFCVVDYSGTVIPAEQAGKRRANFGASLDIFPTIVSLAQGGNSTMPTRYNYLPGVSLRPNLIDPANETRNEVLFTYDFNLPGVVPGPDHIRCSITRDWKGAVYNHWGMDNANQEQPTVSEGAADIRKGASARELYRRNDEHRLELDNLANDPKYKEQMAVIEARLDKAIESQFRAKLPPAMQAASDVAKAEYVAMQVYGLSPTEVQTHRKDFLG